MDPFKYHKQIVANISTNRKSIFKFQNRRGFTLVELIVVIMVLGLLYSFIVISIKPDDVKMKGRDSVRISDINKLAAAIDLYIADNGVPPDLANATRLSVAAVGAGPVASSNSSGWIGADISRYVENLPLDPINQSPYFYRYRHNSVKYEVDALLEFYTNVTPEDGGNDVGRYEKGTDLTIL